MNTMRSRPVSVHESRDLRLLIAWEIAQVTFHRVDDQPPLRLLSDFAQSDKFVPRPLGQPETDLGIVFDAFATVTGGGPADFSRCQFSLQRCCHTFLGLC